MSLSFSLTLLLKCQHHLEIRVGNKFILVGSPKTLAYKMKPTVILSAGIDKCSKESSKKCTCPLFTWSNVPETGSAAEGALRSPGKYFSAMCTVVFV